MNLYQLAAGGAALLLFGFGIFHAALALGAPWGNYAWGGTHAAALPPRLQAGSALLVPTLGVMALLVLIRAGLLYAGSAGVMVWPAWAVFLFLVTSFFGALRSAGRGERRVIAPLVLVAAVTTGYLAAGPI